MEPKKSDKPKKFNYFYQGKKKTPVAETTPPEKRLKSSASLEATIPIEEKTGTYKNPVSPPPKSEKKPAWMTEYYNAPTKTVYRDIDENYTTAYKKQQEIESVKMLRKYLPDWDNPDSKEWDFESDV